MNSKKLLALWGLKWNPFSPEIPSDGLLVTPRIDHFAWRVEQLVQEGGFALITGDSGTGKSVALRIVAGRLSALRDVTLGVIERPQSKSSDFYRELGDIFAVKLAPHNRWGGFKHHFQGSFFRRFASRREVAIWWFRLPLFFLGCGFFGPRLFLGYLLGVTR